MKRNPHFACVSERYLFQEVLKRKEAFLKEHPHAKVISLSIGDTTEPLSKTIVEGLIESAHSLGKVESYLGYGPEKGQEALRKKIAEALYQNKVSYDDIFISDGAKCDIGRLQILFGSECTIGLQDPAYPAYLDTAVLFRGPKIHLLPCEPKNNFFFNVDEMKKVDAVFICSPNNPTGAILSKKQLEQAVAFAKKHGKIIVFDAAYASYVQGNSLKSIYEIEGAEDVAIEIGSFSKMAGFSGVRLGWTVIPSSLKFADGHPVKADWSRLITTFFNGASVLSQKAALSALSKEGLKEIATQVSFYLENASLLRNAFINLKFETYGGEHSPYLWVRIPGKTSWQAFQELLDKAHIITTPGIGFGPQGEGFLRISSFGRRSHIEEAIKRLQSI